jgi:hypothetical protein
LHSKNNRHDEEKREDMRAEAGDGWDGKRTRNRVEGAEVRRLRLARGRRAP